MKAIDEHFSLLFSKDQQTENNDEERVEVLGLITKNVLEEENEDLVEPSLEDKIGRVIHKFPIGKASSIDDVIVEILIECWEFIKQDCYRLVGKFRDEGILSSKVVLGVIKLVLREETHGTLRIDDLFLC